MEDKRRELSEALDKVALLHAPPPHLYEDATFERFREMPRDVFLNERTSMAKSYLRFLVDRIDARPLPGRSIELSIVGKAGAAIQLMASDAIGFSGCSDPRLGLGSVFENRWRRRLVARVDHRAKQVGQEIRGEVFSPPTKAQLPDDLWRHGRRLGRTFRNTAPAPLGTKSFPLLAVDNGSVPSVGPLLGTNP